MHLLIASICCSVAVSVLLKLARRYQVHIGQAVAVNYGVASVLCLALLRPPTQTLISPSSSWVVLAALGVLLPSVFLIMAAAVRHAGIVLSDAAQRLSLLVPLAAAFFWFGESLNTQKLTGMTLACAALVGLLIRPTAQRGQGLKIMLCLLSVWLGYGVIDILFKAMAKQGNAFSATLLGAFVLAGVIMFASLTLQRTRWTLFSVVGGLMSGLLNFGNIYFYVRAHQTFPDNPSLVFASMNIGVIALGTVVGAAFFKEKLSRPNQAGIALAIAAIWVLYPRQFF